MLALFNPKLGKFNVTDKGLMVTKRSFDWSSSKGLVIMGVLVMASLAAVPFWLIISPEKAESVLVNMVWSVFNIVLIVSALLVAFEQPQLRKSHRLERRLAAIVKGTKQTQQGTTLNVSETGCQILLNSWSDLTDEVEVELTGDFGAKAEVRGQIIRVAPMDAQAVLSVEFLPMTRSQTDALNLVIYSDVQEWYSQTREKVDDPMESFGFIATSLQRAFRKLQPEDRAAIGLRKDVQTPIQIYWRGHFHPAIATKLSSSTLQVEMPFGSLPSWETLQETQPLVGLLLSQEAEEPLPQRLLARVESVEQVSDQRGNRLVIELRFPEQVREQQAEKIRQLMQGV
jgi:cellulose synthase (UDP-forming)